MLSKVLALATLLTFSATACPSPAEETRICCRVGSASCAACNAGMSTEEWCRRNPTSFNCPSIRARGRRRVEGEEGLNPYDHPDTLKDAMPAPSPGQLHWAKRRRVDGRAFSLNFDDIQLHDPLCEWILNDGVDSEWSMLSDEERDTERDLLLEECEAAFDDAADLAQCKFYVYALDEYYVDADDLVSLIKFDPEEEQETTESEYQKCGRVTVDLNDAVEDGELSGITIVQEEGIDYFQLDEAATDELAINSAVSIGSIISGLIGATLVKVCRDFNPTDYTWLLD